MATFTLRHFSSAESLQAVQPQYLMKLLGRYAPYFAGRGVDFGAFNGHGPNYEAIAGAKKNALNGSAWRRSRVGIRAISPLTFVSAEASAEGRPVRIAPDRSADSSRYRDSARVSKKERA